MTDKSPTPPPTRKVKISCLTEKVGYYYLTFPTYLTNKEIVKQYADAWKADAIIQFDDYHAMPAREILQIKLEDVSQ